jgi:curved DNA-binding protein CbpA
MEHPRPQRPPGDPYRVLGVNADASRRDIARAYRRAVQHTHPDAKPHDPQAAARFRALTDAYELLGNPDRRADYDRSHPVHQPSGQPPRPGGAGARPRRSSSPFLLGPPPGQPIWAGPVQVEPPAAATSSPGHSAPAAEYDDPMVVLGVRPGQVWGWPR